MVGTMRGTRPVVALPVAALLAWAAPATAGQIEVSGSVVPRGALTTAWHRDPARGCGAAGLCGYSGSVTVQPDEGNYGIPAAGGRLLDGFASSESYKRPPIDRGRRAEAGTE